MPDNPIHFHGCVFPIRLKNHFPPSTMPLDADAVSALGDVKIIMGADHVAASLGRLARRISGLK